MSGQDGGDFSIESVSAGKAYSSGVSRIFVRGVLSFRLLYDCTCVNPKFYPCDFRTRRGPRQVVVL